MRALTTEQKNLLRSDSLAANLLATFYLDEGTYYFCDDVRDLWDGTHTYIGANAITESVEIRSGTDLSAESVTLTCDGNRMTQFGIEDPARVLRDILGYLHQQRRVDCAIGFRYDYSPDVNLVIPVGALKINNCRLVDAEVPVQGNDAITAQLLITLDALSARYSRATNRTRSHADQLEIDATDMFFSYLAAATETESTIYWGKNAPYGLAGQRSGGLGIINSGVSSGSIKLV